MISIHPYRLPLAVPYRWAKGEQRERVGLLVRCDVGGAVGWGEAAPAIHLPLDPADLAAQASRLIDGLDAASPDFLEHFDKRDPDPRLRCGISTAWLSARAAREGKSLGAFLSATPPASSVPVNGLVTEAAPEAAAERAEELMAQGFRTLKIKCTADRAGDLARVSAIRQAAPHARLRLDANESWPAEWSRAHLADLARFDIDYVEQPLPSRHGPDEQAAFTRASPVPVALDESATDLPAISALLDRKAADIVILKTQRAGGPDRAKAIIDLCRTRGVGVTVTVSLETGVGTTTGLHVASLLPEPLPDCGLAMGRFLARDVAEGPAIDKGRMKVPTEPGLGIGAVDLSALGLR
jgi:o-succinylbenzoate synthase